MDIDETFKSKAPQLCVHFKSTVNRDRVSLENVIFCVKKVKFNLNDVKIYNVRNHDGIYNYAMKKKNEISFRNKKKTPLFHQYLCNKSGYY